MADVDLEEGGTRWFCRSCGIVRDAPGDVAPWCRHNAVELPAGRMVPIHRSHPCAQEAPGA